jgi:hypothetical protein
LFQRFSPKYLQIQFHTTYKSYATQFDDHRTKIEP